MYCLIYKVHVSGLSLCLTVKDLIILYSIVRSLTVRQSDRPDTCTFLRTGF